MMTVRCPHCGTVNRAGSHYCNHCGTALGEDAGAQLAANLTTPPAETDQPDPATEPHEEDASPLAEEWAKAQPWLRPESASPEKSAESAQLPAGDEATSPASRLVGNVQGLLDPLRLFSTDDQAEEEPIRSLPLVAPLAIDGGQLRRLRNVLTTIPALEELSIQIQRTRLPHLRIPWVFWLIGLAVGLPIFLKLSGPIGAPRLWPGVTEAFLAVEDLPAGSPVLLLWAYDPATAGEMDLLAEPLAIHLLERQLQPIVITLLPNGAATARRLFQSARERWFASQNLQLRAADAPLLEVNYLSGGPVALTLLGQNMGVGLTGQLDAPQFQALRQAIPKPVLAIVVATEANAVQQGLEQLQPLSQTPLVAFTSAGADPILRPYLDSGQLRGLVSGFDGAYAYQALRSQSASNSAGPDLSQQLVAQNWGHLALLLVLLLGNLAGLLGRRTNE